MEECFFDATTVEPLGADFEPMPEGDYEVVIVGSQNRPTKSGMGSYLELKCQVASGEYARRCLWARLNLKNPNPTAVEMAKRELSAICHATGVLRPKTKEALHGIPVMVRVAKVADDRGGFKNEIKGWSAKQSAPAAAPAQQTAAPAAPAEAPTSAGARPW